MDNQIIKDLIRQISDSEDYMGASEISELCEKHKIYGESKQFIFESVCSNVLSYRHACELREKIIDSYAEYANRYDKNSEADQQWLDECIRYWVDYPEYTVVVHSKKYFDFYDFVEEKLINSGIA